MNFYTNDNAILQIVEQYSDMIIRIAFQYTKSKADAEDIMQDVFLSLIKEPEFAENEERLKAWLIRVTINKCKNLLKSQKRKECVPLENLDYALAAEQKELLTELDLLAEDDRNVLYLFYYEGYSAGEIAGIFEKSEGAVFKQLERARTRLKKFLEAAR